MAMEDDGWIATVGVEELIEGKAKRVQASGIDVLLMRSGEALFAVANRCTHQRAPLDRGVTKVSDLSVTCPAHGSVFSMEDGRVRRGPATQPLQAFDARVTEGVVEVRPRA